MISLFTTTLLDARPQYVAPVSIVCGSRLTLQESNDFRSRLEAIALQGQSVEIDLSAVREFDTAGLATLVGAFVAAGRAGLTCRFTGASKSVRDILILHRLSAAIPLDTMNTN